MLHRITFCDTRKDKFGLLCLTMYHSWWYIYVSQLVIHINCKNLVISTFLIVTPSVSIKGLFYMQGAGSIFEKNTQKSPPFPPCTPKFWRCWSFAKPTYLKQGFQESAWSSHFTAKTARASVRNFFFFLISLRCVGNSPHPCQPPP